jgi:ribosomal 50S subunit-recycling heat shock protein
LRWAVTYTNPLAAIWSGTPLGVPLHPVQAYAALAFLALAILLWVWLPLERRRATWPAWADGSRRGHLHHRVVARLRRAAASLFLGALDGPQIAAVFSCSPARWCCSREQRKSCASTKALPGPDASAPDTGPMMRRRTAALSLPRTIDVPAEAQGQRLDQFIAAQLEGVSRSRVQLLIDQGDVLVNGEREKASLKLRGGEQITITGEPHPAPLKATPKRFRSTLSTKTRSGRVNKPAGMMVHAGSGQKA